MKEVGLKRGFMEFELFKKIVDDCKEFEDKIKKIKIGNHGEPTMHPRLPECIKYARDSGVADIVELFTNGSKLEPDLNKKIVESGLQRINVSLEGLTDHRYFQVAGVKQNFQEIIDGVRDLYAQKEAAGSDLVIYVKIADEAHALKGDGSEVFKMTDQEREFFYETFSDHCDEIYVEKVVPQWAETQLDRQNEVGETGMYGQKISEWKEICPFTFMYLHFNCDGTVSPCTLDWPRKVVIGNVQTETVSQIWFGKRLRELQIAQVMGKRNCINFCKSCSAPMVCVEEDLDPHAELVSSVYGYNDREKELGENSWVDADDIEILVRG